MLPATLETVHKLVKSVPHVAKHAVNLLSVPHVAQHAGSVLSVPQVAQHAVNALSVPQVAQHAANASIPQARTTPEATTLSSLPCYSRRASPEACINCRRNLRLKVQYRMPLPHQQGTQVRMPLPFPYPDLALPYPPCTHSTPTLPHLCPYYDPTLTLLPALPTDYRLFFLCHRLTKRPLQLHLRSLISIF